MMAKGGAANANELRVAAASPTSKPALASQTSERCGRRNQYAASTAASNTSNTGRSWFQARPLVKTKLGADNSRNTASTPVARRQPILKFLRRNRATVKTSTSSSQPLTTENARAASSR
ncbi:MAG: hypothetical protein IPK16_23210 [Anaerolineales bacterium]|nr:hypothetical protein [Anaerolineales bacterium]